MTMDWFRAFKRAKDGEEQDHERLLATDEEVDAEKSHQDQVIEQELQRNWVDVILAIALPLTFFLFASSTFLYWQAKHIRATDTECTKRMSGYC